MVASLRALHIIYSSTLTFALPVQCFSTLVGLCGVYDIAAHYDHEATRGVEYISAMERAMQGRGYFQQHSPTTLLQRAVQGKNNASIRAVSLVFRDRY